MIARFSYAASTGGVCAAILRLGPAFLAVRPKHSITHARNHDLDYRATAQNGPSRAPDNRIEDARVERGR